MKNPLRLYFWMLGQDARFGLLRDWGFAPLGQGIYMREGVALHRLGLTLPDGLLYSRAERRYFQVPAGSLPPDPAGAPTCSYAEGLARTLPHWLPYERWLEGRLGPSYRRRLLRICPPLLRPTRRHWQEAFSHAL